MENHMPATTLERPNPSAANFIAPKATAAAKIEHHLTLHSAKRGRYSGTYQGEIICVGRDPEHDACRVLLGRGITGTLITFWQGSDTPAMRLDIQSGAQWSRFEASKGGLQRVHWKPFNGIGQLASDD